MSRFPCGFLSIMALLGVFVLASFGSTETVSSAINIDTAAVTEAVFPRNEKLPNLLRVPNIVHQIYDYQNPNFFLYLSFICVQRYVKPDQHILWVNDEGRYRKAHWFSWQHRAAENKASWEWSLAELIRKNIITVKFLTFPFHPPGNTSTFAPNKAHRSDFVRLHALNTYGGIYLDTDAFAIQSLTPLRYYNFTMSFDNIVNPDITAPKRLNNGVMSAAPGSEFVRIWTQKYASFNPDSFAYDSSEVPYHLMTQYPDLIHLEMSRVAPMSYAFQTSRIAESLTCGILIPEDGNNANDGKGGSGSDAGRGAIWAPKWKQGQGYTFTDTQPDRYMYQALSQKLVLHLTMTQVRGHCMMRKALAHPDHLANMPSLLGRIFRIALYGKDAFDYSTYYNAEVSVKDTAWKTCRDSLGMHTTPDTSLDLSLPTHRQQYTEHGN
mmetsp:Transcript_1484/g.2442  ORF Transcript_1484/g.2442 Transcript_1484/m.2442 type:complete len:437 (+) Transcript_1484:26-1336(+)